MSGKKEFPKKYDHQFEQVISALREEKGAFKPNPNAKETFTIPLPPPNVTGVLHAGHALMITVEDVMTRHQRMMGKKTLRVPGTDHAGISTQVKVEEQLKKNENKTRQEVGREQFLEKTRDRARAHRKTIVHQTKKMGASCDRSREQFTLSEQLSRAVRKSFSNLVKAGKVYQGNYITNRCTATQTVVSDLEIDSVKTIGKLYYIRYFIDTKNDSIVIATTRPETIFADVAIAVHPQDKRYKKLIGKKVLIPIINRSIPVIGDEAVDMTFGTGALKITPTHDATDFEIAKRHNLPMDVFAFDKQGLFTHHAGENFAGKEIDKFFDNIVNFLDDIGNLVKTEDHEMTIPYSEKGGVRIQPMLSKQWFVDVKEYADQAYAMIESGEVTVHPEKFKETFYDRLGKIRPRCISRQLWRGHRIPVRYTPDGTPHVFDEDTILHRVEELKKNGKGGNKKILLSLILFNLIADSRLPYSFNIEQLIGLLYTPSLTPQHGSVGQVYLSTYAEKFKGNKELLKECEELKEIINADVKDTDKVSKIIDLLEDTFAIKQEGDSYTYVFELLSDTKEKLTQDEDVFDTWFSSALRPFSIMGRPEQTQDMEDFYPNTVLETGYDIIFFRVARMMMMGLANTGKMPFKHVYLNGLVRDEKGRKFSKSLGNGIDPLEVIEKYGTDALRLSLVVNTTSGTDTIFSRSKIDYYRRFINKLWNATRFTYTSFLEDQKTPENIEDISAYIEKNIGKAHDFDLWILHKYNGLIENVSDGLNKFQYGESGNEIIKTLWHDFCDRYIEITKQQKSPITKEVTIFVLATTLKLLHPYAPFVTEKLRAQCGFSGLLCTTPWPTTLDLPAKNYKINLLMETITGLRNLRAETNAKPHEKVQAFVQSGTEFSQFVTQYETLIKHLIKADEITLYQHGDKIPEDFQKTIIVDLVLGVKGIQVVDKKAQLQELEKKLEEEKNYIQTIRGILSNEGFLSNAPDSLVAEKKKKMEEVKQKITLLELEISKIKAL